MPDRSPDFRRILWRRGILQQVIACVLFVAGLFCFGGSQLIGERSSDNGTTTFLVAIALGVASVACWGYGTQLFLEGRRLKAPVVLNPSAVNSPFVLYLRPFESQSLTARLHYGVIVAGIVNLLLDMFRATEEQKLAKALSVIAPGIAVGAPGEEIPPLGFQRLYIEERNWQSTVREVMTKARLVVLRLGGSGGLVWELETAKELLPPERLLLLVPSMSSLVVERGNHLSLRLGAQERSDPESGMKLPRVEHSLRNLERISIAGLIYFEADWSARAVPLETEPFYFLSDLMASLKPVLKQLGVRRTFRNRLRHSLWFKLGLGLAFWLLVLRIRRC